MIQSSRLGRCHLKIYVQYDLETQFHSVKAMSNRLKAKIEKLGKLKEKFNS